MIDAKMRERIQAHLDEINAEIDAPVNADGDSIEDMRAVQDRLGSKSVDFITKSGYVLSYASGDYTFPVNRYRITAKYSDKFDPDCMDEETFERAVIGRGDIVRVERTDGSIYYYDIITVDDRRMSNKATEIYTALGDWCDGGVLKSMTAITKAQYAKETAPEPKLYTQAEVDALCVTSRECERLEIISKIREM